MDLAEILKRGRECGGCAQRRERIRAVASSVKQSVGRSTLTRSARMMMQRLQGKGASK